MAINQEQNQPIDYTRYYTLEHPILAAGAKLWAGTLAMNDAGQAKPVAGGVAGTSLLGLVYKTCDNTASASPLTPATAPLYLRGVGIEVEGLGADLPKATEIGKPVALHDNNTIKKTVAANDLTVTLLAILPGNRFRVYIP